MRGRGRHEPGTDRWQRSDWWGVVLDAPDASALGRFYADLLGWPVHRDEGDWVALDAGEGVGYLAFQTAEGFEPPVWPPRPGSPGMQLHLDFEVDDLDAAVTHAVELGATVADHQPQDDVRVLLDPAGHPFCLYA